MSRKILRFMCLFASLVPNVKDSVDKNKTKTIVLKCRIVKPVNLVRQHFCSASVETKTPQRSEVQCTFDLIFHFTTAQTH